jgi:hypothetical protein
LKVALGWPEFSAPGWNMSDIIVGKCYKSGLDNSYLSNLSALISSPFIGKEPNEQLAFDPSSILTTTSYMDCRLNTASDWEAKSFNCHDLCIS